MFTQRPVWGACATPVAFFVRTLIAERIVDPGMRAEAAPDWGLDRVMKEAVFNGLLLFVAAWYKRLAEFFVFGVLMWIMEGVAGSVAGRIVLRWVFFAG